MSQIKSCLIVFTLLSASIISFSQQPEELLNSWANKSPIEKTYLHFDRETYVAGEIAWFKAYLFSEYMPDTISTVLYVELINESGDLILRKILPVLLGNTNGQLELADSLRSGNYTVHAYSPTMLNNGLEFICRKKIFIYGKDTKPVDHYDQKVNKIKFDFFPEGGNLIIGFTNTIAFKATDLYGLPLEVSGIITDEKGNKVSSFNTYHDGLGIFEMIPEENKKYSALIDAGDVEKFELPAAEKHGIVLSVIPHPQGSLYEINQKITDPTFKAAYMIGQMQHHVVFRQTLDKNKDEQRGVINTSNLNSGILQITVFNQDGIPLAERLCFVNNNEYLQNIEIRTDTINFNEKGKNHFKIFMKDTVQGSLSVSVSDAEFGIIRAEKESIVSNLLLSSDLKGYIHNPSWYFNGNSDSVSTALDILMMTNGWRRFKWNELSAKLHKPLQFSDPVFITVSGRVNSRGTKKPFADKQIMAIITAEGLGKSMQLINTDKQGYFVLDSLLFFGKGRILFIDTRGKKSQYIDVIMTGDSINKRYEITIEENRSGVKKELVADEKIKSIYKAIQNVDGLMLEEVKLNAVRKTPTQLLEEKYTTGMFGGFSEKVIDLVNTEDYLVVDNVFDYLNRSVPGLEFATDGGNFTIYYRQGPSASSMGPIPMVVYLNEIETDPSIIATLPIQEIALVKVYNYFVGASGNAPGGALSIYTRKSGDFVTSTRGDYFNYKGFSVVKEFYVPDYKTDPSLFFKSDNRITLVWRPNIFVNNINPVIPISFYNNDRAKKFRVVIEGMTNSGKLIHLDKIITNQVKEY